MGTGLYANGKAISAKAGGSKVVAAFPDVCWTPPSPPAGPIPVPYPDTSFSKDLKKGTKTVFAKSKPMALEHSVYNTSPLGDEPATQGLGKGLISATITGVTRFIMHSFDVICEGKGVTRHTDLTLSNNRNSPPFPTLEDATGATPVEKPTDDGVGRDVDSKGAGTLGVAEGAEPPKPKVSQEDLDKLYVAADPAKKEIDKKAKVIADNHGGKVKEAPLKKRDAAEIKINRDYDGVAADIKDVARNTIIVPDAEILAVAADLEASGAKVKVIDGAKDDMGYSGVNSTMMTEAGIVAEIQVNSPEMIYAKEPEKDARVILGDEVYEAVGKKAGVPGGEGHKFYEEYRDLPAGDPRRKPLEDASKAYYAKFRSP